LVKVIQCRVGDTELKEVGVKYELLLKLEKFVLIIHFTQIMTKTNKQTNKQTKQRKIYPNLG